MTQAFQLLHPTVQRKLWDMKWTELRPIQVDAINHLLGGTATDCIIESPTASGKTEAAFLPVLSAIADEPFGSVRAMYIGPLKALINDQFGRLEELCERMEMPVCRWHGDVDDGPRKALLARPGGVLLITPESLEAMFVLRPTMLPALFGKLGYVVIDETHAFLGSERGAQLISQLHRLRVRAGCDPTRIGLSATLGDPDAARRWLRRDGRPVHVINSKASDAELRLKIRGYWRQKPEGDDDHDPTTVEIARAILLACHGKTNLVFANSKGLIEELADELTTQAREMSLGDEVVVHHGSLSREQRDHAERVLRGDRPCTAVCSNTLELGIDIGAIDDVVQVSPPWSVASLVQRVGRSGRRPGTPRVLRGYFPEDAPTSDATAWDRLLLDFIRGIATIELMLEHWLEPPMVDRANLSTLVQQLLSTLAETGGIRAHQLYGRLTESGAFVGVTKGDFAAILRELGARDLVEQLPDSTLVLGLKGQRIVEHYSFYAAFKAAAEFQVVYRDRVIGTLPESMLPGAGEHVILAGRRWLVDEIDADARKVLVSPSKGRRAPRFASGQPDTDPALHARMRALLTGDQVPTYLDDVAREMLAKARAAVPDVQLDAHVRTAGQQTVLQLWGGTRVFRTLWLVLASATVPIAAAGDVAIEISAPYDVWVPVLQRFAEAPDGIALARFAEQRLGARIADGQKFDVYLPADVWCASYARERLDIPAAVKMAARIVAALPGSTPPPQDIPGGPRAVAIHDVAAWADQVLALKTQTPLPKRVVLVPSEAHAHALRVELAQRGNGCLIGTRFITVAAAARMVVDAAGIRYSVGEERLRQLRVRKVLGAAPALAGYRCEDLRTIGWERAFAETVEQLEAAGLKPHDLANAADVRARDLAVIWQQLDADANESWTMPRLVLEAAQILEQHPETWSFDSDTLGATSASTTAVHARFLRAIPRLTCGVFVGRPVRRHLHDRLTTVLGPPVAAAVTQYSSTTPTSELEILAAYLFEPPARLADPSRTRSSGPDGSVSLELYAGIDEELDGVVSWVAREVFEHGTPLQDIAVLAPTSDPFASLIADRLYGLPWPPEASPVYLANGRCATASSEGARLLAVLTALEMYLPADSLAELLPCLRYPDGVHVSPARARETITRLATIGGSVARPDGASTWRAAADRIRTDEKLASLVPGIDDLVTVAELVLGKASLETLWSAVREYATVHLGTSVRMSQTLAQLDEEIVALAGNRVAADITGVDAVSLMLELLRSLRLRSGRFGDPSIFVGTVAQAAGLRFAAVRVIGLAEGAFPATRRENVVLPSDAWRELPPCSFLTDEDYAISSLHAFWQVAAGTTNRIAFSAARADLEGSEREPGSVLIEVAAALGRPDPRSGQRIRDIPTPRDVEHVAFGPARSAANVRRLAAPLFPDAWLRCVAEGSTELPSSWTRIEVRSPFAVEERMRTMDGLLGSSPLTRPTWGASPEQPLSASSLRLLLSCPQRFLLERILGFRPREDPPSGHRIDALAYGKLLHQVLEEFGRAHGATFGAREHDIAHWVGVGHELASAAYDSFLAGYPLVAAGVVESERRRLRRDVQTFIEHDWNTGRPRRFVAVEQPFGPLALPTSSGPLFVSGWIDRIDVESAYTLIRDIKTGRSYPRERDMFDPDPAIDIQLALYAASAEQLAGEWDVPRDVAAAYVYVDRLATRRERAFYDDRHALQVRGRVWLDVATGLISEHAYVKTTDDQVCARCDFSPVCGDECDATIESLATAAGPLAAFRDLRV